MPITEHIKRLESEKADSQDQLKAMGKKLNYLEHTYNNAKKNIDDILGMQS